MNLCNFDFLIIIIIVFISIFIYDKIKSFNKENFQSTNAAYQADVEAIRNLSSIAQQLTLNNKLSLPGGLSITNNLLVGGELSVKTGDPGKQVKIGSSQIKFRGDGIVHYGLTNDKDGKFKISNLSGTADVGSGLVNDCVVIDSKGNIQLGGDVLDKLSVNQFGDKGGQISIKNSKKNGIVGKMNEWIILNMTGTVYGDKLAFYRYNDGIDKGAVLELYDNGVVNVNGEFHVNNVKRF
jgi:hypothetical protein